MKSILHIIIGHYIIYYSSILNAYIIYIILNLFKNKLNKPALKLKFYCKIFCSNFILASNSRELFILPLFTFDINIITIL